MKRIFGIVVAACFLVGAQAAFAQTKVHTETKTKQTGPGPNVKTKTETTVGTVREYEAGKKIKVEGPDKTYAFDLDKNARVEGSIAVGQSVTVEWNKDTNGKEHVLVLTGAGTPKGSSGMAMHGGAATAPSGHDVHMKSESTTHQPGPDVKTKTEMVVGTVKEYEPGKKIKVTGPNNKDYSFDLDEGVGTKGTVAVGMRVKVQYTKTNNGDHVTTISPATTSKKTRRG